MINYDFMFDDKIENYQEVLQELRSGKAQLIDIREQSEWQQNRFKCAIHVPLSDLAQGKGVDTLKEIKESNKKIYLHCRSGNRVRKAKEILARYGCTQFSVIPISMLQMLEQGFQLTK
jgi:rhodanese-related sulfurtransferase